MARFAFLIRKPRGGWPKEGLPAFVLEQDNWNDYGFQTHYRLSYVTLDEKGRVSEDLIGPVKILRAGQSSSDGLLVNAPFSKLDDSFCSVGTSLDYYERLRLLSPKLRRQVLEGLHDVVDNPAIEKRFRHEEGWTVSLFRDDKDDGYLKLARGLLTGDYSQLPGENLQFCFTIPGWIYPIDFDFLSGHVGSKGTSKSSLPERIAVLVGQNGSGKSTVLARLARVALGTLDEREKEPLTALGQLDPAGIGFPRVITVTFSAFDSFRLPGADGRDRRKILKELESGEGRFAFIGLRDIAAEGTRVSRSSGDEQADALNDADRVPATKLKSIQNLADEFALFLSRVKEKNKADQFDELIETLLQESAFKLLLKRGVSRSTPEQIRRAFLLCSTGHKIAALVVVGLMATLERSSLVLFDEPETHLHPPLLAALMDTIRKILRDQESYCIVATHSPVVVQESLAKHIKVVKRDGSVSSAVPPKIETFGESIGLITADVFGLNSEATDYHGILDKLIRKYPDQSDLEKLFLNGQMSHQARAYTMSRRLQSEEDEN